MPKRQEKFLSVYFNRKKIQVNRRKKESYTGNMLYHYFSNGYKYSKQNSVNTYQ